MRLSHNRRKHDPSNLIVDFIKNNPGCTLMMIFKFIQENKFNHTRATIGNILHDLEIKLDIKNTSKKNKHPRYEIIDTSEFQIQNIAYAFKDQICHSNLMVRTNRKEREKIKEYKDSRKELMVDMILRLGLISYYTCLSSYERGLLPELDDEEKRNELQKLWLRNAMSLENNLNDGQPSTYIDEQIERTISDEKMEAHLDAQSEIKDAGELNYDVPISIPEKVEEAKKLKQMFSKMFPDWFSFFRSDEKVIALTKERLREVCIKHTEYLLK